MTIRGRGSLWFLPLILVLFGGMLAEAARAQARAFAFYTCADMEHGPAEGWLCGPGLAVESDLKIIKSNLYFRFFFGDGTGASGDDVDVYAGAIGLQRRLWKAGPLSLKAGYQAGTAAFPDLDIGEGLMVVASDSSWTGGVVIDLPARIKDRSRRWRLASPAIEFYITGPGKPPTFARGKGLCGRLAMFQVCLDKVKRKVGPRSKTVSITAGMPLGKRRSRFDH